MYDLDVLKEGMRQIFDTNIFRIATHPRQYIKRGNYVLFKFYVDGEALSEVSPSWLSLVIVYK